MSINQFKKQYKNKLNGYNSKEIQYLYDIVNSKGYPIEIAIDCLIEKEAKRIAFKMFKEEYAEYIKDLDEESIKTLYWSIKIDHNMETHRLLVQ
jgi:hypothetical protein